MPRLLVAALSLALAVMGSGVFITYAYKLDRDTLSLAQQRNQNGPFANPFTLKLVRVE